MSYEKNQSRLNELITKFGNDQISYKEVFEMIDLLFYFNNEIQKWQPSKMVMSSLYGKYGNGCNKNE